MGIENRDYYREGGDYSSQWGSWGNTSAWPPVVKYIILANVIVFVLQLFLTRDPTLEDLSLPTRDEYADLVDQQRDPTQPPPTAQEIDESYDLLVAEALERMPRPSYVTSWLQLETTKVFRGQVWRIFTCAFCHGGLWHILFNMLFLYWFGTTLERMYGSREFCLFYFAAAFVSSVFYMGLDAYTRNLIPAIGASGAVMGVMMLFGAHYPRQIVRINFFFPVEIRWVILLYVIYDLYPVVMALGGNAASDGIAHAAHLGGLAFGFAYWKMGLRLEPWWDKLQLSKIGSLFKSRPKVRIHQPSIDQGPNVEQQEVDEVLRKINAQGRDSLTQAEQAILDRASQRYRNRRD